MVHAPGKGIMDASHKLVVTDCMPSENGVEILGLLLEFSKLVAQFNVWGVHDDVE